jgi:hypothetical protein
MKLYGLPWLSALHEFGTIEKIAAKFGRTPSPTVVPLDPLNLNSEAPQVMIKAAWNVKAPTPPLRAHV